MQKNLSVSPMLRPIISETSKTAKIILVLYWAMDLIGLLLLLHPRPQYSTKMIFAVLDVSLIMGLNIGETDKFFALIFAVFCRKTTKFGSIVSFCDEDMTKIT